MENKREDKLGGSNMNQITFHARVTEGDIDIEDGGQAKIVTLLPEGSGDDESGIFIRLQSWCEGGKDHPEVDALIKPGKRYLIKIEEVEG